jgi:hypothetical protein
MKTGPDRIKKSQKLFNKSNLYQYVKRRIPESKNKMAEK